MNDKILAVQRMQDYIERRLGESISLAELAETARFSPWYAARIFKELTGLAPADYIRRLRLGRREPPHPARAARRAGLHRAEGGQESLEIENDDRHDREERR